MRFRTVRGGAFLLGLAAAATLTEVRGQCDPSFQRGDVNQDDKVDLSDPISTLGYLFLGTTEPGCHDSADADDNGKLDLSDAVYAVSYLFLGGTPIPAPHLGECGIDPTADELNCADYVPCGPADPSRCTTNDCCDAGSYCEKAVDDCDGIGTCVARPEICLRIFDPVCGCDGVTYSNACNAAAAGVNVVHKGECGQVGGCRSDDECDIGSFCQRAEGLCDEPGECAVRPEGCEKILDPVCGCDDVTYDNACEAARQGMSVKYFGECIVGKDCTTNDECEFFEYCKRDVGECDEPGQCFFRPDLCALVFAPVCGCDGNTYANDCFANSIGVNLASLGPCEQGPECRDNEGCEPGTYCSKVLGFCDEMGVCVPQTDPAECADDRFNPVCGCNNITYDNACQARAAGVAISRFGACEDGAQCEENTDCAEDYVCVKKEGFCAEPGLCLRRQDPADCENQKPAPVCGCDEVTYANECAAHAAGVSVAYGGECDGIPRCDEDADCQGPGVYCQFREGFCGGLGTCGARPEECPEDLVDPVCGCDGVTYVNECRAMMAGVGVSFRGTCRGGDLECETSAACGQGSFCSKAEGDCDGLGQCDNLPVDCEAVFDPVCGCDGLTYPNECEAHAAGVNVLQRGECP